MEKKVKGLLFRLPTTIIMLIVVIGSFVVKISATPINGVPITWFTPLTILVIFVLYLWGEYLSLLQGYNSF
ncbi:MAG: hypothetical protein Q8L27_02600 [archaeon]|nr:hypothetical protein [archaeon]